MTTKQTGLRKVELAYLLSIVRGLDIGLRV